MWQRRKIVTEKEESQNAKGVFSARRLQANKEATQHYSAAGRLILGYVSNWGSKNAKKLRLLLFDIVFAYLYNFGEGGVEGRRNTRRWRENE